MSLTSHWSSHWSSDIIYRTADLTEQILTPVCLSYLHSPLKPAPSPALVYSPSRNTVRVKQLLWPNLRYGP